MHFSKKVKESLIKLGVNTVYLFGSRAQNFHTKNSDFDVAILFKSTFHSVGTDGEVYQELYEIFSDYFRTKNNIDIVFLHKTTGQLRYHVVKKGIILFDDDEKLRSKFEDHVIMEHSDFEYFRKMFEESIMERAA